jgi:predicted transcriptional regulator
LAYATSGDENSAIRILDDVLDVLSVDGKPHSIIEIATATCYTKQETEYALRLLFKFGLVKLEDDGAIIDPKLREIILGEDDGGLEESGK